MRRLKLRSHNHIKLNMQIDNSYNYVVRHEKSTEACYIFSHTCFPDKYKKVGLANASRG